jgi:hypothetical protein
MDERPRVGATPVNSHIRKLTTSPEADLLRLRLRTNTALNFRSSRPSHIWTRPAVFPRETHRGLPHALSPPHALPMYCPPPVDQTPALLSCGREPAAAHAWARETDRPLGLLIFTTRRGCVLLNICTSSSSLRLSRPVPGFTLVTETSSTVCVADRDRQSRLRSSPSMEGKSELGSCKASDLRAGCSSMARGDCDTVQEVWGLRDKKRWEWRHSQISAIIHEMRANSSPIK